VITGAGREQFARTALKAGAFDYISKTSNQNYLIGLPKIVLRAFKARKDAEELVNNADSPPTQ